MRGATDGPRITGELEIFDRSYRLSLRMLLVMAAAFLSRVLRASITFSCVSGEPFVLTHRASSSILAARASWPSHKRVSTSAVAMLSCMAVIPKPCVMSFRVLVKALIGIDPDRLQALWRLQGWGSLCLFRCATCMSVRSRTCQQMLLG